MTVLWLTAFLDRRAGSVRQAERFWARVTDTTLSPTRGDRGQFATFLAVNSSVGDPFLRVQTLLDGNDHGHLDVHVADVAAESARAVALGGSASPQNGHVIMTSPAGLRWCLVPGEAGLQRPAAVRRAGGWTSLVDQLCVDVPPTSWDVERAFWQAVTGWELRQGSRPEFAYLARPQGVPLRLLLQRLDVTPVSARASCHLDLACSDVPREVALHETWGARVVARHPHWTTLTDPTGSAYCVTARDPVTGTLPA
ncbi:MAG: VOC family protein [Dermatophilaceae bacterium]